MESDVKIYLICILRVHYIMNELFIQMDTQSSDNELLLINKIYNTKKGISKNAFY